MSGRLVLITEVPVPDDLVARARLAAPEFSVMFEADPSASTLHEAEVAAGHLRPDELAIAVNLRWNHLWTAGADADLGSEMLHRDITLTSSAGNGAIPLAEHAMLLLLMLNRDVPRWMAAQSEKRWDRFRHGELAGKTVGIIGMGNTGRDLASKCAAFHMRVLGLRNRPELPQDHVERVYGPDAVTQFAAECDYIVVTAPLTPRTHGLFGKEAVAAMRPHAAIVNVSRGEIVDHDALLEAVRARRIHGAGLDAHRDEPLPATSPWWSLPNVIVTPHNGATTAETLERAMDIFVDNLRRYAKGSPLRNVVDKQSGYAPP